MILSKKTISVLGGSFATQIAEEFVLWSGYSDHQNPDTDFVEAFNELEDQVDFGNATLVLRAALDISEDNYTETSNKVEITLNSGK